MPWLIIGGFSNRDRKAYLHDLGFIQGAKEGGTIASSLPNWPDFLTLNSSRA